jgi:voltage-dependent anion channel protein 2
MGKGPGFYQDIGKKAKDLINKDYTYDQKFTVSTATSSGLNFLTTGNKKGESFAADINTTFTHHNISADVKVDTKSNILATVTVDEFAPGVKSIFSFTIPDQKSGKVEVRYTHDNVGITGAIGVAPNPVVDLTAAVGSDGFVLGGEVSYDTGSGLVTKYNAAVGYTKADFSTSVHLADKGDVVKASYIHLVNPVSRTQVAAEIAHRFSKNENTFTVGGLYGLDPLTTIKGRLNNHGKLATLLQHEWRPKSLVTLSGEVDTKALDKSAKIGLALALKP